MADMRFFDNCTFVLQCDRKGNKDFVKNASGVELSSSVFQESIKSTLDKYGYSFANGMMTDVMTLKQEGLEVSCANISCGYYNPHCENEYVVVKDVMNCLDLVIDIMTNFGADTFGHKYTQEKYSSYYSYGDYYKKSKEKGYTSWLDTWDEKPTPTRWQDAWDEKPISTRFKDPVIDSCPSCNVTSELEYDAYYATHLCQDCKKAFSF
jgi:hypothetical protein